MNIEEIIKKQKFKRKIKNPSKTKINTNNQTNLKDHRKQQIITFTKQKKHVK